MKENTSKMRLPLIAGAIFSVIGVLFLVIGYSKKAEESVSASDSFIIYGLITLIIGCIFLISFIAKLVKKESTIQTQSDKVKILAQAALLAALCYIGFQYLKIPIPVGTEKTALHIGNTFCVLAALLLGGLWGGLAGSIGMTIADLTSDYVTSAPKTLILKLLIGLIVGFVAHTILHISKEQSAKKILTAAIISSVCGMAFNVVADPLVGYFYKIYILNIPQEAASIWAKIGAATTLVNAIAAVVVAVLLYTALRPALIKADMFRRFH